MGGVLIDLDLHACHNAFREKAEFTRIEEFIGSSHQLGFVSDMESGTISEDEFYAKCIPYCNPDVEPKVLAECFGALLSDIEPYKIELLKELTAKYPLYLLSNTNPITSRRFRSIFAEKGIGLEDIFTKLFLSFEMKMLKPEVNIYKEAASKTGIPAEELLFIDDSEQNVEAAKAAGMQSLLYIQGTDLRTAIQKALCIDTAPNVSIRNQTHEL